jgi:hypothetical protein
MTPAIVLAHQTGNQVVDRVLTALVELTELLIPNRAAGYYLSGSYANGSPVPASDLDVMVVLRSGSTPKHVAGLLATYRQCGRLTPMALDVVVATEDDMRRLGPAWFAMDRKFLFGTDVLATLPPAVAVEVDARRWMQASMSVLHGLYARNGVVPFPVGPPDPADEWFGFAADPIRLPDGREEPGLRRLVTCLYWPANALIVRRTGQRVVRKDRGVSDRFRELFGDAWFPFLLDVFTRCKGEWGYRLPADPSARSHARRLCELAVAFHNEFLTTYRDYLLEELRADDPGRPLAAAQELARFGCRDPELEAAVLAAGRADPAIFGAVGWPGGRPDRPVE